MVNRIFEEIIDNYKAWEVDKSSRINAVICKEIWSAVKSFHRNNILSDKEYNFLKYACEYYLKDMGIY